MLQEMLNWDKDPLAFTIAIMFICVVAGAFGFFAWKVMESIWVIFHHFAQEGKMRRRKKQREAFRMKMEDVFMDGIVENLVRQRITDPEARAMHDLLGKAGLWGMYPKKFDPPPPPADLVKKEIRRRTERKPDESLSDLLAVAFNFKP